MHIHIWETHFPGVASGYSQEKSSSADAFIMSVKSTVFTQEQNIIPLHNRQEHVDSVFL